MGLRFMRECDRAIEVIDGTIVRKDSPKGARTQINTKLPERRMNAECAETGDSPAVP